LEAVLELQELLAVVQEVTEALVVVEPELVRGVRDLLDRLGKDGMVELSLFRMPEPEAGQEVTLVEPQGDRG
jgi:hypothetical protein